MSQGQQQNKGHSQACPVDSAGLPTPGYAVVFAGSVGPATRERKQPHQWTGGRP